MTEQQIREIFDRHAVEHLGFMFFPCRLIREEFGASIAAFAEAEFRLDCSEWSTHRVGLPGLLRIVNGFEVRKQTQPQRSEIDDIIRIMFEPNSRPNWNLPYEPEADLKEAERENDAAMQTIRSKITPEELERLQDTTTAYGAASAVEAFDRGFRAGMRMILQMIRNNVQPLPTA